MRARQAPPWWAAGRRAAVVAHRTAGGTTIGAANAAKVRSAAPKRSPHRYGRPSASNSATKSNSRQTAASSSTSTPGRISSTCPTMRCASGHPRRIARSSHGGTPWLLKRSASSRAGNMWTYISRRPFGPSTSSKRRHRRSTSSRAPGSTGNSRCSGGVRSSTHARISASPRSRHRHSPARGP